MLFKFIMMLLEKHHYVFNKKHAIDLQRFKRYNLATLSQYRDRVYAITENTT